MSSVHTPRFIFPARTTSDDSSYQSLLISLLRGAAALQVAAAHLRAEVYPSLRGMNDAPLAYQLLAFFTGFAHQAVVIFFLISGWLVGGSLLDKWSQPRAIGSYTIDRISRLWTVLVPTFFLMLLCAAFTNQVVPVPSLLEQSNEYSALVFLGNMIGLQKIMVPNFGHNYALWSLSNETWYYILLPLLLVVYRSKSWWRRAGFALCIAVIASFLPFSVLLYFSIWLMGAAFSKLRIECGYAMRTVLIFTAAILSIYYRLNGGGADLTVDTYVQDLTCSLPLLLLLASLSRPVPMGSRAMRHLKQTAHFFSEFSFTLYVSHVPTIALLRYIGQNYFGRGKLSPHHIYDYFIYFGVATMLVVTAYLLYFAFESNTFRIRRFVKAKLLFSGGRPPPLASLSAK